MEMLQSLNKFIINNGEVFLLLAFLVKMLTFGISMPEATVLLGLMMYISFHRYIEKNKTMAEIKEQFSKEQAELKVVINKQSDVITRIVSEIDVLKTNISGIKLGQGFKKTGQ